MVMIMAEPQALEVEDWLCLSGDHQDLLFQIAENGSSVEQASIAERILAREPKLLEAKTRDCLTPLMVAASSGALGVMTMLLAKGANIKAREAAGQNTSLHLACGYNEEAAVGLLLEKGANPGDKNRENFTPLAMASKWGAMDSVVRLLRHGVGVELEVRDGNGRTPLWHALKHNHGDVARVLLMAGADPDLQTSQGLRVRDAAVQGKKPHRGSQAALHWWGARITFRSSMKGYNEAPDSDSAGLCCPLSSVLMTEAVVATDGITYQKGAIRKWIEDYHSNGLDFAYASPVTGKDISTILLPDAKTRSRARQVYQQKVVAAAMQGIKAKRKKKRGKAAVA